MCTLDYENGVADVLGFLAGDSATVERNAFLRGHRSGTRRQIDVVVHGPVLGMVSGTVVVDCKRWARPVDVADVEAFVGLVADVDADGGLLVTTKGSSRPARRRAEAEHEIRLEMMSLGELMAWAPKGTVTTTYAVPVGHAVEIAKALGTAGSRVAPCSSYALAADEVTFSIIRHYGTTTPRCEVQERHMAAAEDALRKTASSHGRSHTRLLSVVALQPIVGLRSPRAASPSGSRCQQRPKPRRSSGSTSLPNHLPAQVSRGEPCRS